jgi:hypothetical protein
MQNLSESHVALPTDLNLSAKAQAVVANSKRINITPLNNTTWNAGDAIMWDFPVNRAATYLNGQETSLMIRVRNNDASTIWVDHNAASFIQRIDLYSSGQLLETIDNYGVLYAALLDAQSGPMERCTYNNLLMGSDNDTTNNTINVSRGGVPIANGASATFYIPIISGVIGSALGRYLPLCDIAELKVVVTLAPVQLPIIANTAAPTAWTVTASEFVITTVQLDPGVDRMLHESHNGQIVLSTEMWRNFNTILASGGSSDTVLIPIKPISAKSLLVTYRPSANLTSYLAQSVSGRVNPFSNTPNGSSFQLLCGSTYLPQKPIVQGSAELFMETFKCFHGLGNVNSKTTITAANYEVIGNPATALTATSVTQAAYNTYSQATGSFVVGISLDVFSGQSSKFLGGLNLSIGNSFVIQSYKTGTPLGQQTRMDGFLHYDALLIIDPSTKQITFKM